MATALALVLCLVFGAGDQYLGSIGVHPWTAQVSLLSAPWLVLPFAVGLSQRVLRRATVMGTAGVLLALVGYCVMTLSPLEHAHFSVAGVEGFIRSGNYRWLIAGIVLGPCFAWLGFRWRMRRGLLPILVLSALLSLEPVAHAAAGRSITSPPVVVGEVAAGVGVVLIYVVHRLFRRLGAR